MNLKSKFPFFRNNSLVYLDSAATTQTPAQVINVAHSGLENKGNPNRSSHIIASKNEEKIDLARENVARFINCNKSEIVFTKNTTDSINIFVDSVLKQIKKGDEIILSIAEHHSNMLPYRKMIDKGAIFRFVGLKDGIVDVSDLKSKISSKTKIVSLQHSSNVLGGINPVEKIGSIIKKFNKDIIYIIDAANSISHIPVDVKKIKCDFCAFSSHKMYGPDGVGVLFASKKFWPLMEMVNLGGGVVSDASVVKNKKGDRLILDLLPGLIGLDGGTPNVSNIIALSEAINFIRSISYSEIRKHELELLKLIIEKLNEIEGVIVYGPKDLNYKVGLVSFSIENEAVKNIGEHFNRRRICIRYGSHCAFPLSDEIGAETIRVSLGCYNDEDDVEKFIQELRFYLDKKRGLIKNKNLEEIRDIPYYRSLLPVQKSSSIINLIKKSINENSKAEVIIQAGHFLAIPDLRSNSFYPSIRELLPEHLHGLLDEFGMTSFPLFTFDLGCQIISELKESGIKAKILIVANDTTGINELKNSEANKNNKTAEEYREEFLSRFDNKKIPDCYSAILNKYSLSLDNILKFDDKYYTRESLLRGRFKKFIDKNKEYFSGMIDYSGEGDKIDVGIKILDNQNIKTCRFNTFNSKTGGRFCIVEIAQLIAEIFGSPGYLNWKYLSNFVKGSKSSAKEKIFVMLTPEMCNKAVISGAELYIKLFLRENDPGSFKYFNFQFGPDSEKSLALGTDGTYLSNKGKLLEIKTPNNPNFAELWKLVEYNLLYDIDDYFQDMVDLFQNIKIKKDSKILDTCVGPGFFTKELIESGYDVSTMDISDENVKPFLEDMKSLGLKHEVKKCSWLDIDKNFKEGEFDFVYNRGNSFIFANGGLLENKNIDKKETLSKMKETLVKYYKVLKPGGYLYLDKYKDSEVPSEKIVAKLNIEKEKKTKDVVFYVERNPDKGYRYASIILRDEQGDNSTVFNKVYDLTESELENLLREVGFKFKRLNLKSEKHFVVWLAQK